MPTIIEWEGPYNYRDVTDNFTVDDETRCDYGVYQIYGPHDLFTSKKRPGHDKVLLYIGMTVKNSAFSGRIASHGFCHDNNHDIYLGRVDGPQYDEDVHMWESEVKGAEALLINKYTPPYNSKRCGDLRKDQLNYSDCIVINKGMKIDLDDEVTADSVCYQISTASKLT